MSQVARTRSDAALISAALTRLSIGCRQQLQDGEAEVYLRILLPYGGEAVSQACDAILSDPDAPGWFPRTQEIILRITGSRKERAVAAWHQFRTGLANYAGYTVAFDDPLIHHCAKTMGGWSRIGLSNTYAVDKLKEDFVAIYSKAQAEPPDPASIPNRLEGENPPPEGKAKLIGDHQRARQVLSGDIGGALAAITHRPAPATAVLAIEVRAS